MKGKGKSISTASRKGKQRDEWDRCACVVARAGFFVFVWVCEVSRAHFSTCVCSLHLQSSLVVLQIPQLPRDI